MLLAVALAGAAGAAVLEHQRRLRRAIAADPLSRRLASPARGQPLTATSADGTALHIERFGPAQAPLFVLAHGWTEQLEYWTLVAELLLERGFQVAAFDLRGHGASAPAASGDYRIARFGEDVEAVLATLGAGRDGSPPAALAGHSLGAISIVAWAERHAVARRVRAVALLNTGVENLIAQSLLAPLPWLARAAGRTRLGRGLLGSRARLGRGLLGSRARLPRFVAPLAHTAIRYAAFAPEASPALVAFYERMLLACPPDVRAAIGLALSDLELAHALARIDVPALVVAGELDRLTPPAHAERIARALPRLERLLVLPGSGHMAPLERPAEVAQALTELAQAAGLAP
jgi:pimeloyl-ACP methyl ester carboxylesterase